MGRRGSRPRPQKLMGLLAWWLVCAVGNKRRDSAPTTWKVTSDLYLHVHLQEHTHTSFLKSTFKKEFFLVLWSSVGPEERVLSRSWKHAPADPTQAYRTPSLRELLLCLCPVQHPAHCLLAFCTLASLTSWMNSLLIRLSSGSLVLVISTSSFFCGWLNHKVSTKVAATDYPPVRLLTKQNTVRNYFDGKHGNLRGLSRFS